MRTFSIAIICLTFFELKAQYKTMFPVDSITWVMLGSNSDGTTLRNFYYNGKTTIMNDEKYYSILDYRDVEFYLREDTINGKTWFKKNTSDTTEVLLMDLELELNDTIFNYYSIEFWGWEEKTFVTKIDTNSERKIIEFALISDIEIFFYPMRYMEGLGNNLGFPYLAGFPTALCKVFHNDDLVFALDTVNLTCPYGLDVNNFNIKEYIKLFPNPASSFIQIQIENPALLNSKLNFYNISGRLMLSKQLNNLQTRIELSTFKNQMVFFEVKNNDHHFTGKIIKQ